MLGHGIGQIRLPLNFPGLRETNAYIVRGDSGVTLIDCGLDDQATRDALESGLDALDLALEDVTTLICTHMHPDHMGLAHRLVENNDIQLVMHESAAGLLDRYNDWSIGRRELATLAEQHGAPVVFVTETASPDPRPDWAGLAVLPDRLLKDGEEVAVGHDRTLSAIHTPGHEVSHICLVDSRTGVLFSGDHILPRITPVVMFGHDADPDPLGTYLESLRRIENMDIGLTYPAHVNILERGSLRARQIALHHERRLGAMLQEVRARPRTAWEIMRAVFRPHLGPLEQRLALSETLAHLEYMRIRDELTRAQDNGVWRYSVRRRPASSHAPSLRVASRHSAGS